MLTAHMIVKNEDRFVWYAISSVLANVDKFIIYDTGSTDNTIKIIQSFKTDKIEFGMFRFNKVNEIAKLRDKQIRETESDWIWIVDGDEIYSDNLCKEIREMIRLKEDKLDGIVVGRYDLLGDIYHYQDESVGEYKMLGRSGHMALRLINKKNIPGLHVAGEYPYEEYFDKDEVDVIYHKTEKFSFTKGKLFHAMYLQRSTLGANLESTLHRKKRKVEWGHKFSPETQYPEVFTGSRPSWIPDVMRKRSLIYEAVASVITPFKIIKRKLDRS